MDKILNWKRLALLLSAVAMSLTWAWAQAEDGNAIMRDALKKLEEAKAAKGKIVMRHGKGKDAMEMTTDYQMQKPNKMYSKSRLKTGKKTLENQIVCDGTQMWLYRPADKQYTKLPCPQTLDVLAPLTADAPGKGLEVFQKPGQEFKLVEVAKWNGKEAYKLEIVPMKDASEESKSIKLWAFVSKKDRQLLGMEGAYTLFDGTQQTMSMEIKDLKLDPAVNEKLFAFTPPKGVTDSAKQ